jgi:uncharacterized membrane protein YdjX (TVP38/TMEM64 family)
VKLFGFLFVFPFLYFASVVPVGVVAVLTFVVNVRFNWYITLYFNGDISGIVALLVIGSPVFGVFSWVLVRLEGVPRPTPADHLRRCAFLYAFVGILGAMFATEYIGNLIADNPMYEMPKAVVIWVVAGYAILVDALVLLRERRRNRADHGGDP